MNSVREKFKDDSGLILGVVLIGLTIVGTILGSVLMVSQISMESKGQSLETLKTKNVKAQVKASGLKTLIVAEEVAADLENSQASQNCGLPTELEGEKLSCQITHNGTSNIDTVQIETTDEHGEKHTKRIEVPSQNNPNDGNTSNR